MNVNFSYLKANNSIIATHLGVVYKNIFYWLLPTFDKENWGKYSPGSLILEDLIKWSIKNKLETFDLTIGKETYKNLWSNSKINLYRMNEGVLGNINIEQLAPIDLRKKKVVKKMSGNPATHVEHINPINSSNPYMNEVPMLFGFNDLVYT